MIVGWPTLAKNREKTFDGIFSWTIVNLVFSRETGFEIARIEFSEKLTAKSELVVLKCGDQIVIERKYLY